MDVVGVQFRQQALGLQHRHGFRNEHRPELRPLGVPEGVGDPFHAVLQVLEVDIDIYLALVVLVGAHEAPDRIRK